MSLAEPDILNPNAPAPPAPSPTLPPSTTIVYVPVPGPTQPPPTTATTQPLRDSWNPLHDGMSFNDLLGIVTLVSILIGIYIAAKKLKADSEARQKDTIREVVEEVQKKVQAEVAPLRHELTANSGSSMKDKSDQSAREMNTLKAAVSSMNRTVETMNDRVGLALRKMDENARATAKIGERLTAVEQAQAPRKRGARRWR